MVSLYWMWFFPRSRLESQHSLFYRAEFRLIHSLAFSKTFSGNVMKIKKMLFDLIQKLNAHTINHQQLTKTRVLDCTS